MLRSTLPALSSRWIQRIFACGLLLWGCDAGLHAQNAPDTDKPPFQLKAESNLVVVSVVVRDGSGKAVEGLKKEDFKLLDRGKEQAISQFETMSADAVTAGSAAASGAKDSGAAGRHSTVGAQRFFAFYFDNLNDSEADLMRARDAAEQYLASDLKGGDRVAVFTSEKMLLDFTSDKGRVQEALAQLQPSARSRHRGAGQLSADSAISDYQALEMLQTEDCSHDNAWLVATAPTGGCNPGRPLDGRTPNQPSNVHIQELKMKARAVAEESAVQARGNLQQLEAVTKYLAQAPGLRTVILVSSGFLSQSEQVQLDRITEEAIRSQVVINSLDPKGLAVGMREADATRNTFSADPHVNSAMHQMDAAREFAAADVMAEFAQGTGGEFIHNDNDLKAGFARLAGQPAHYVLAFTPRDLKPDGKYHELKVALTDKQRGFSVQARRGYFAPLKKSDVPMDVAAGNKQPEPIAIEPKQPAAEAHANAKPVSPAINLLEEKTRAALNSKEEAAALPIGIEVSPTGGSTGGEAGLSVLTHLDIKPMHLRKDAGQNIDTITFTVGVFDPAGTLVSAKQRSVKLNATDEQLAGLKENGVEITTSFPLKPGSYRVRAVVAESEEQKVAATSRDAVVQ